MPTLRTFNDEKTEAARLGFSVRTLQMWRLRGGGPPFIKLRSAVRYDPLAVDAWMDSQARHNTSGGKEA